MKRMLMIASVASMIDQSNKENIKLLQEMGYEVHVACNFEKGNTCSEEKIEILKKWLEARKIQFFQIDFERNALKLNKALIAYKQILELERRCQYDFIHCHTPIGGVIGRITGHKTNTKVIYTAHGFHFYRGAPIKNWILYFPVEWICAYWTDVLITINQEDYQLAQRCMKARKIMYVPGVGIDLKKFQPGTVSKEEKRKEMGLSQEDFLMLSVGELNRNKNHEIVIRAMSKLKDTHIHYMIAGQGSLLGDLQRLVRQLHLQNQVHFLGYRKDVALLYQCADIYLLPSLREGLNISLMEAMASGLPVVASKIRGNTDLIEQGKNGILCKSDCIEEYVSAIRELREEIEKRKRFRVVSIKKIQQFSKKRVNDIMKGIYLE